MLLAATFLRKAAPGFGWRGHFNWNSIEPTSTIIIKNNWIGQVSKQTSSWRITTKTVNSFRRHGNFANGKMGDKKADKKETFNARTAGWKYHTRFVFIFGYMCCNKVCVYQRVSTNVFLWIKHWTYRRFEQIKMPNFHNESSLITIRLVARPLLWLSCTLVYM